MTGIVAPIDLARSASHAVFSTLVRRTHLPTRFPELGLERQHCWAVNTRMWPDRLMLPVSSDK